MQKKWYLDNFENKTHTVNRCLEKPHSKIELLVNCSVSATLLNDKFSGLLC